MRSVSGDFPPIFSSRILKKYIIACDISGTELLAVDSDNKLWSFKDSIHEPELLLENISFVTCGTGYWLAIDGEGTLWGEGNHNENGQVFPEGSGQITEPVAIMDSVVFASAGDGLSSDVKQDGTLWVWGKGFDQGPEQMADEVIFCVSGLQDGKDSLLYIAKQNELWCYGYDILSGTYYEAPQKLMDEIGSVDMCSTHVLAQKTNGDILAWGNNTLSALCSEDPEESGPITISLHS